MDHTSKPNPYLVQFDDIASQKMITFGGKAPKNASPPKPPPEKEEKEEPTEKQKINLHKRLDYRIRELGRCLKSGADLKQQKGENVNQYIQENIENAYKQLSKVLKIVTDLGIAKEHFKTLQKNYFELIQLCYQEKFSHADTLRDMTEQIFEMTYEELGRELHPAPPPVP